MDGATSPIPTAPEPVLCIEDLVVCFDTDQGEVRAVDGVSYAVQAGETLGIVGESGSGKSVTFLAAMDLLPRPPARIDSGRILFGGEDLRAIPAASMRALRGNRIAMIFQDPMSSLNPFLRVGKQLVEMLEVHQGIRGREARHRCVEMLERVGLPDALSRMDSYAHELSGGMRQRVMIAMMLLNHPVLLIADEPTTALDVTIQAQILDLLSDLQRDLQMSVVLITHDLGVVAGRADRVVVMYAGRVMEIGPTEALFASPRHPYTVGLLRSVPRMDVDVTKRAEPIPGRPPEPLERFRGCPFAPRCGWVREACHQSLPPMETVGPGHEVRCFAADEVSR